MCFNRPNSRSTAERPDCRKIIFGGTAFRIVYRLIPNEEKPIKVKVIVIARRADNHVYLEALRRLGRERFANLS